MLKTQHTSPSGPRAAKQDQHRDERTRETARRSSRSSGRRGPCSARRPAGGEPVGPGPWACASACLSSSPFTSSAWGRPVSGATSARTRPSLRPPWLFPGTFHPGVLVRDDVQWALCVGRAARHLRIPFSRPVLHRGGEGTVGSGTLRCRHTLSGLAVEVPMTGTGGDPGPGWEDRVRGFNQVCFGGRDTPQPLGGTPGIPVCLSHLRLPQHLPLHPGEGVQGQGQRTHTRETAFHTRFEFGTSARETKFAEGHDAPPTDRGPPAKPRPARAQAPPPGPAPSPAPPGPGPRPLSCLPWAHRVE